MTSAKTLGILSRLDTKLDELLRLYHRHQQLTMTVQNGIIGSKNELRELREFLSRMKAEDFEKITGQPGLKRKKQDLPQWDIFGKTN